MVGEGLPGHRKAVSVMQEFADVSPRRVAVMLGCSQGTRFRNPQKFATGAAGEAQLSHVSPRRIPDF